jgi:hypothetical protein
MEVLPFFVSKSMLDSRGDLNTRLVCPIELEGS